MTTPATPTTPTTPTTLVTGTTEIIGILGGMGPAATADFYAKLVSITPGSSDQDHLRTVIWSDPTIPDRTEALLGDGPDPTPGCSTAAASCARRAPPSSPFRATPRTPSSRASPTTSACPSST